MVGAGLGLLGHGVGSEHHGVELVQGGSAHQVADVREVGDVALEAAGRASLITEDCDQGSHHDHRALDHCRQGQGQV